MEYKEHIVKTTIMVYTAIVAIFISQHVHDSCDLFVLGLHILACYLYTKEVMKLFNIKQKLNKNNNKKTNIQLYEKERKNNNELMLTTLFKK